MSQDYFGLSCMLARITFKFKDNILQVDSALYISKYKTAIITLGEGMSFFRFAVK